MTSPLPPYKSHWSPMGRRFSPPQVVNLYIVYSSRLQYWNATYGWAMQTLSFEHWYTSLANNFDGEEAEFERWYWGQWLQAQGHDVATFLCPLFILPGLFLPIIETHPYYCCYSGCHRVAIPFGSKQGRDLHFFTQHCGERTTFWCDTEGCGRLYQSVYSLRRHQRYAHRTLP
ncbi:hypothetical protein EV361DRAFT_339700 [Lentinula raphanica]|nr:hypothetical protein EV361DRAFT_339700 [Lentinula raphanica]